MTNLNINYLRIPLYGLYRLDVTAFGGLTSQQLGRMKTVYEESDLQGMVAAVNWAVEHPEHDFRSMLPNLRPSNAEIHKYLCTFAASLRDL